MTKAEKEKAIRVFKGSEVEAVIEAMRDDFRAVAEMALESRKDIQKINVNMERMDKNINELNVSVSIIQEDILVMKKDLKSVNSILHDHEGRISHLEYEMA
jgi:archaellum component FlaC